MKSTKIFYTLILMIVTTLLACNSNTKLNQTNAEKAINNFLARGSQYFKVGSIKSIEPLSQFSDNEATTNLTFSYSSTDFFGNATGGNIQVKCVFKKNIDKKWIFTSINPITRFNDWGGYDKWISSNQEINILTQ